MNKILFISIDPIVYRRRVINQANAAKSSDWDVHVISVGPSFHTEPPWKITYLNIPFKKGPLRFIFFNFLVLVHILKNKYFAIHARGLWVLPAVLTAKILKKFKLVYDAHEYFAGHELFQKHLWRRITWLPFERLAVPVIDVLITVSEPLAGFYKKRYPGLKNIKVIRSLPIKKELSPISKNETLQIVFHGYYLPGRGIFELLDALYSLKAEKFKLTLLGEGPLKEQIEEKIKKLNLSDKVSLMPFVPSEKLLSTIHFADLGVALIEADCLNRKFSLPNKFFEYIHAGVAVLASTIPTLHEYVKTYNVGYCADVQSTADITKTIHFILNNRPDLTEKKKNCIAASEILNWQNESIKQIAIYNALLND